MSKEAILITIGVLTAISPFSGLPLSWLAWILPIFGIAAAYLGYSIRKQRSTHEPLPPAAPITAASEPVHYETPHGPSAVA